MLFGKSFKEWRPYVRTVGLFLVAAEMFAFWMVTRPESRGAEAAKSFSYALWCALVGVGFAVFDICQGRIALGVVSLLANAGLLVCLALWCLMNFHIDLQGM
jgi:hypothetical protein